MRYALFVMLLLATTARGLADGPTVSFVSPPEAIPGWSAKGAMREYDAKTLYEYIDGAADLFNSYGFVRLATADYVSGAGEHAVTVEVYDMGEPLHAFGLFASERPPDVKALGLGNQGYAGDGVVAFWQGRQYVKVSQLSGEGLDDALALPAPPLLFPSSRACPPNSRGSLRRIASVTVNGTPGKARWGTSSSTL